MKKNKNSNAAIWIYLIIFVVFTILFLIYYWIPNLKYLSYEKTKGTIIESNCKYDGIDSDRSKKYICIITVEFSDNNKNHTITKDNYSTNHNNLTGKIINIYYNKSNYNDYELDVDITWDTIILIVFIFNIFISIFALLKNNKKNKVKIIGDDVYLNNKKEVCDDNTIYFPLFDAKVDIWYDENLDISSEYLKNIILYVTKLNKDSEEVKELISALKNMSDYYIEKVFDWRKYIENFDYNSEINFFKYMKVSTIHLYKDYNNEICFGVLIYIPWDEEHGICWKIMDGKTVYVGHSDYLGYDPHEYNGLLLWDGNFVTKYINVPENKKSELKKLYDKWYNRN